MGEVTRKTGSLMNEVPEELKHQIHRLEELFTVPKEKLKQISDHFVSELEKGLSVAGGSIVSLFTQVLVCHADNGSP